MGTQNISKNQIWVCNVGNLHGIIFLAFYNFIILFWISKTTIKVIFTPFVYQGMALYIVMWWSVMAKRLRARRLIASVVKKIWSITQRSCESSAAPPSLASPPTAVFTTYIRPPFFRRTSMECAAAAMRCNHLFFWRKNAYWVLEESCDTLNWEAKGRRHFANRQTATLPVL